MTYMEWYEKGDLSEAVKHAIAHFEKKYGTPPSIVETSLKDEPLPEGMTFVVNRIRIPKGHILVGEINVQWMETDERWLGQN